MKHLNTNINVLLFTNAIKNDELSKIAKSVGMNFIEMNSKMISEKNTFSEDLSRTLEESKGNCVIATKVAKVGFNGYNDLVFTIVFDTDQVYDFGSNVVSRITKVPLTLAFFTQRRKSEVVMKLVYSNVAIYLYS